MPRTIYIPIGGALLGLSPPIPVIANPPVPGKCARILALNSVAQQCGNGPTPQTTLYWDACDPQLDGAEVHAGSPDGPIVWSSTSGLLTVSVSNTTYYLQDRHGQTLATEEVRYERAARCSAMPNPTEQLTASPNPVLSCAEDPLTGTQTALGNSAPFPFAKVPYPVEIHVSAPDGPKMAYSGGPFIYSATGDWVRDDTTFFLTQTDLTPLAMERVFLLPIRSCGAVPAAPPPAIQPKPAAISGCGAHTTLAWYSAGELYSGGIHPVEIREETGRTVARFDQGSGLFDVSPSATTAYHLFGYTNGAWKDLAAATVTVNAPGCPGTLAKTPATGKGVKSDWNTLGLAFSSWLTALP